MTISVVVFLLVMLQLSPTWAGILGKKKEPVIVSAETVQALADKYVVLTTLGAKLDSKTITVAERYELLDALAQTPRSLDDVYCGGGGGPGEGNDQADYCRGDEKKAKQIPAYDLENSKIKTSVGEVTLTQIVAKHQQVNQAMMKPFVSCSVGRIQVYSQSGNGGDWTPLQTRWLVYGPRNPPWPFAAVDCGESAGVRSNVPEYEDLADYEDYEDYEDGEDYEDYEDGEDYEDYEDDEDYEDYEELEDDEVYSAMEEAFEALRDRCSTGKLVIISEWNIELNNKGVYDKTAEADCWLGKDHKYYLQERPYFSSENSLRKTPTSETWGYGSALSNRYSGWGTHVLGKLSDQKGH